MKYCTNCGQVLLDHSTVCGRCGRSQSTQPESLQPIQNHTRDHACLDRVRIGLSHERKAWKIYAIVWCIMSGLYAFLLFMFAAIFNSQTYMTPQDEFFLIFDIILYSCLLIFAYIPTAIASFIMCSKCTRYLDHFETDPAAAVQRCGSAGSIVIAAIFNNIALIFVIINLVYCKSNKAALDSAIAQEQAALPAYFDV